MAFATEEELRRWYRSFLPTSRDTLPEFYYEVMTGFSATLREDEAGDMRAKRHVLLVRRDVRDIIWYTTRSPDYLELRTEAWNNVGTGSGIIIGVVDSGITESHPSFQCPYPFSGSIPRRWRGACEFNDPSTDLCNCKLLGARNMVLGERGNPPNDDRGHGTHVAGIAAGAPVNNANVKGYASGTASGAAPGAHLAVYKVNAGESEVLSAVERAVRDGVHIVSMSLGDGPWNPLWDDEYAIAALAAVRQGIVVVCAGGNSPEDPVDNPAPWVLTVGASTMDRALRANLVLDNGITLPSETVDVFSAFEIEGVIEFPGLREPSNAGWDDCTDLQDFYDSLSNKIVMCWFDASPKVMVTQVKGRGGYAILLMNTEEEGEVISYVQDYGFPVYTITHSNATALIDYVNRTMNPGVAFHQGETSLDLAPSPAVPSFSSRGPNPVNGGILKPDVVAPGNNILSAGTDGGFALKTGSSMATPHVSGIAAVLLEKYPHWSPAMVRSAIMTTSTNINRQGGKITQQEGEVATNFDIGSGHVQPAKMADPGLVYDIRPDDYIRYLCGLEYNETELAIVTGGTHDNCRNIGGPLDPARLNYPSIWVTIPEDSHTVDVDRNATIVVYNQGHFESRLDWPHHSVITVAVSPETLSFTPAKPWAVYNVTFTLRDPMQRPSEQDFHGRLTWRRTSPHPVVTAASPLAVTVD